MRPFVELMYILNPIRERALLSSLFAGRSLRQSAKYAGVCKKTATKYAGILRQSRSITTQFVREIRPTGFQKPIHKIGEKNEWLLNRDTRLPRALVAAGVCFVVQFR